MTRPFPETVIAWVIIALSLEGLIGLLVGIATPVFTSGTVHVPWSIPATLWVTGGLLVVYIVLAALILSGFGWARIVLVVLLAISVAGALLGQQPISLAIVSGVKLVVFSYFFFRRDSNEYFAKSAAGAA